MSSITVKLPAGATVVIGDVLPECTVGDFKEKVAMEVGYTGFNLHVNRAGAAEELLKNAVNTASLVSFMDAGATLRVARYSGFSGPRQAQRRLDKGLTTVATSLKNGFKEVGGKVDGVKDDTEVIRASVGTLLAAGRGEVPDRVPDQTDYQRIQQLRNGKRRADSELPVLLEREALRIAQGKRGRSAEVTLAAEKAEGCVDHVTGEIMGADLEEKKANHEAQGKVIAAAVRKAKAKGKAQEKAIAKAKAKAKAKAVADVAGADELEQEVENAIFAPVAGVVPEAGASSSDKAAA
jgi:hypothetical protein